MGSQQGVRLLSLHFLNLLIHVDAENFLEQKHRDYYTHHAKRIRGRISHRHLLAYIISVGIHLQHCLLRGAKARRVGDRPAHYTNHLGKSGAAVGSTLQEVYHESDSHIHRYCQKGQHIHSHAPLLE